MKKSILVMLFTITMGTSLLAGCGEGTKIETGADAENTATEVEISNTTQVEEKQSNVSEELKNEKKTTIFDWAETVTDTEPKLVIWNMKNCDGTILDENEEYTISEEEVLMLYSPVKYEEIQFEQGPLRKGNLENFGKCTVIQYEYKEKNDITIIVKGVLGNDYTLNTSILLLDSKNDQNISIEEWIEELKLTEDGPRIIVWNDETGVKKVLQNGEEYQLQEGDKTGIYYSEGYELLYGKPEDTDSCEYKSKYMEMQLINQQRIDFEYVIAFAEDYSKDVKLYATFIK